MSETAIRPPRGTEEQRAYDGLARRCFNEPDLDTAAMTAHAVTRLAAESGNVIAGAMALRAEALFGGRTVPAGAVACVCVAPETRGRGVAERVLNAVIEGLTAEGRSVAMLWTPAVGVYRRWGWEVGGLGQRWSLPLRALSSMPRPQSVQRGITPAGMELQRGQAAAWNAALHRPPWWWSWKYPPDGTSNFLYESRREGEVVGVLGYSQRSNSPWGFDLIVTDLWGADQQAIHELYGFLAGHGSQSHRVEFDQAALPSPPPFLWELTHHDAVETGWYPWMIRLLDIPAALTQRGWPTVLSGTLEFQIESTRLTLTIDAGKPHVKPGGAGTISITEGQLAAWYAGTLSGPRLRQATPAIPDSDLELMTALTAGAGPWLPDVF